MLDDTKRREYRACKDSFTEDDEMVIILELAAHGDLSSLLGSLDWPKLR